MRPVLVLLLAAQSAADLSPAQIATRAGPTVVSIKTSGPSGESTASGFLVDPSGTIITNLHVIEGARAIAVKLANGDVYDQVRIRSFDARKDLAVIQIPGYGLPTVELGDSDTVQAGQSVVLIGNPLGVLEGSLSAGVVSAIRTLEGAGFRVIQTDAAANPGNSGGPLLNSGGKAIGVLSFKLRGTESLNFVIPINYARGLLASAESFGIEDLPKRLAAGGTDLFAPGKTQFPVRWKSLASGTTKLVRVEGEHMYVETLVTEEQKRFGVFYLAELKKTGDKYAGVIRSGGTCVYYNWLNEEKQNFCRSEEPFEITVLTPTRIEGTTVRPGTKFDCGKCQWRGKPERSSFVWIPE